MAIGVLALFENKSWRYILVNTGYNIVAFVLMGLMGRGGRQGGVVA